MRDLKQIVAANRAAVRQGVPRAPTLGVGERILYNLVHAEDGTPVELSKTLAELSQYRNSINSGAFVLERV